MKFSHYKNEFLTASFYHDDGDRNRNSWKLINRFVLGADVISTVGRWSIIFFSNFKTKARMTWLIEVSDYSIPLQWFNHVTVDMIKFLFLVHLYHVFFFLPKTSKQVFHCRTMDAEFTGNSKVVDREIIIMITLVIHLRYNH